MKCESIRKWIFHSSRMKTFAVVLLVLACLSYLGRHYWLTTLPAEIPETELAETGEQDVKRDLQSLVTEIKTCPRSAENWGKYAMSLRAYLEHEEANRCFEIAASLDRSDYRWPYLLAMHHAEGDPGKSIEWFQRALEASPPDDYRDRIIFRLVEALLVLERVEEARQVLGTPSQDALRLRVLQVKVALASGNERVAAQVLNEIPDHPTVLRQVQLLRAEIARRQGRVSYAMLLSKRAAETAEPTWPDALLEEIRSRDRSRGGRLDEAAKFLRAGHPQDVERLLRPLLEEKSDARAFVAVAEARQMLGNVPGAIAMLRTALQLDSRNLLANYQMGALMFDTGERMWAVQRKAEAEKAFQESISWLDKALELNPTHGSALLLKAIALERFLDRRDEGIALMQKFIEIRPEAMEGHYYLGEAMLKAGKRDAAIAALTRAVELSAPGDQRAFEALKRAKPGSAKN